MTTSEHELYQRRQGIAIGNVTSDVVRERWAQIDRWGNQSHDDIPEYSDPESFRRFHQGAAEGYRQQFQRAEAVPSGPSWHIILMEELHEALAEAGPGGNPKALRQELVQTAAVALAWVEDLDSRELSE